MWAIKLQSAQLKVATLYVIEVQNGHLDFIPRFSVFVWKRELYVSVLCSFKKWATTNLLPNKLRRFVNSCEWRMSLAGFSQGWGQKIGSLLLLSLATDPSMVRKRCWLLEGKVTQPIEQQAENRSDNCILDTNYLFAGVAFVTKNSNETTRRSLLGHGRVGTRLLKSWETCPNPWETCRDHIRYNNVIWAASIKLQHHNFWNAVITTPPAVNPLNATVTLCHC